MEGSDDTWARVLRYVEFHPFKVLLEASSVCQLGCPLCPTSRGITGKSVVGSGFLKLEDFKGFVDGNPSVRIIELSNWGEIFLNPDLGGILKYAHEKKVRLRACNGVNLNSAGEDILEAVVKYGMEHILVSIDGASEEVYRTYRRGGDFARVMANIRKINGFKKKYGSEKQKLSWQFVVMGHNEHELPKAREMAKELGMGFVPKVNWDPSFSPVKNADFVKKEAGITEARGDGSIDRNICYQLWLSPQVNWDGKLLGCCCNRFGELGNVFTDGLEACLRSEKYGRVKQFLLGKLPGGAGPCAMCGTCRKIMAKPLDEADIRKVLMAMMRWELGPAEAAEIMEKAH